MRRLLLVPSVALAACFGSLSPDRTPTGVDLPETPGPIPPPSPGSLPPAPLVASFTVSGASSVTVGSHVQLSVTLRDSAGSPVQAPNQIYFWSDNSAVAAVSELGLVTGKKMGSANVTVIVAGVYGPKQKSIDVRE